MRAYTLTIGTSAVNLGTAILAVDAAVPRDTWSKHVRITIQADENNLGGVAVGGPTTADVDPTAGSLKGVKLAAEGSLTVIDMPGQVALKADTASQVVGVILSNA